MLILNGMYPKIYLSVHAHRLPNNDWIHKATVYPMILYPVPRRYPGGTRSVWRENRTPPREGAEEQSSSRRIHLMNMAEEEKNDTVLLKAGLRKEEVLPRGTGTGREKDF